MVNKASNFLTNAVDISSQEAHTFRNYQDDLKVPHRTRTKPKLPSLASLGAADAAAGVPSSNI